MLKRLETLKRENAAMKEAAALMKENEKLKRQFSKNKQSGCTEL